MSLDSTQNFLFYTDPNGKDSIQVIVDEHNETVWTTQKGMSEIFGVGVPAISKHLSNIFEEGELVEDSVVSKMEIPASDGKLYSTNVYNLDAIISVGYRVNSQNATRFRIWATSVLKEYLVKGFAMDDERLKQGNNMFNKNYFDQLLERIREIHTSERMFWEKITDLYTTAVDYNVGSPTTNRFFATVQNKLEYAITKMTAPEIITARADAKKKNMGLLTWSGQKRNEKIIRTDITVAKNYLEEKEISELNRLVELYLVQAEMMVARGVIMTMAEWEDRLNALLEFSGYEILQNAGTISRVFANKFAEEQFNEFRVVQDREYVSDFNKVVQGITSTGKIPVESFDSQKLNGTFTISIKDEYAKEKKKLDESKLSEFNQNLSKALKFNPKDKGNE